MLGLIWFVAVLGALRENASLADRRLGVDARLLVELVAHVAVARERQACVVPELVRDVDHAAAFMQ